MLNFTITTKKLFFFILFLYYHFSTKIGTAAVLLPWNKRNRSKTFTEWSQFLLDIFCSGIWPKITNPSSTPLSVRSIVPPRCKCCGGNWQVYISQSWMTQTVSLQRSRRRSRAGMFGKQTLNADTISLCRKLQNLVYCLASCQHKKDNSLH